jgi:hypothetical protein
MMEVCYSSFAGSSKTYFATGSNFVCVHISIALGKYNQYSDLAMDWTTKALRFTFMEFPMNLRSPQLPT